MIPKIFQHIRKSVLLIPNSYISYIHLQDHNQKINPENSRLKLSYMNPKVIAPNAPPQQFYKIKLKQKHQKQVTKKLFQNYKTKLLTGVIDQQEQQIADPLWINGKPQHYYKNLSMAQLMAVSSPQLKNAQPYLSFLIQSLQTLQSKDKPLQQGINDALMYHLQGGNDRKVWWGIEQLLKNKVHKLSTFQILQLTHCFKSKDQFCSPQMSKMMSDLIFEDIPKMTTINLMQAFYLLRNQKSSFNQQRIIEQISTHYQSMTTRQKIQWLLVYVVSRKPLIAKAIHKKVVNQDYGQGLRLVHSLNLNDLNNLTQQSLCMLIFSLAHLRVQKCYFIVEEIQSYLIDPENINLLKPYSAYICLAYASYLNDCRGIHHTQIYHYLLAKVQQHWKEYTSVQQIKMVYSLWTVGIFNQKVIQLYKSIPITADSTLLHYFCQIEMQFSSEREWQVITQMGNIQSIPLGYFQSYCRFYNYLRSTTEWDLQPIYQKLENTEFYYDCSRIQTHFQRTYSLYNQIKEYHEFTQFNKKTGLKMRGFPMTIGVPIQNLEYVMFAFPQYQISIDVVNEREYIPGTNNLKPNYLAKVISLQIMGWKHIVINENQLEMMNSFGKIYYMLTAISKYKSQQLEVIKRQQQTRAQEISILQQIQTLQLLQADQLEELLSDKIQQDTIQQQQQKSLKQIK